jgi:MFS family permease
MDLVFRTLPVTKRTMGVSMHSLVRRVPMALGPVLGGLCISAWGLQKGIRIAFVAALALAVGAAVLQQVLIKVSAPAAGRAPVGNPLRLLSEMSGPLRRLLVSDILVRFCEQIPYAFVVIWAVDTIGRPVTAFQFGVLTAIEMVTAALIYVPVAYFADRSTKKPFVVATFAFFTAFPLLLLFCRSFWPLVMAFVVRGLKEFGEPTRKALIMDLAPEDRKAAMFGLYYLMRDTIVSAAAFGGALLWRISPETNFLAAFLCGLVGTLWFAVWGSDLGAESRRAPSA